ncbi:hypothetical protein DIPPA_20341 [Diplonema papillatum]|nr:hypothetical protein DIPPA_20341 [Diplonema papillatum]
MFETPGDIGKFAADLKRKALPAPEKLQPMEHLPSPDGEFTNRVVYLLRLRRHAADPAEPACTQRLLCYCSPSAHCTEEELFCSGTDWE